MGAMTLSNLAKQAPAIRRLEKPEPGKIDTYEFLRYLDREHGFETALAAQGTPHKDSKGASKGGRQGKHLVASVQQGGFAIGMLNSHTVRRKAWIAGGYMRTEDQPLFLVACAMPLQRWRGHEAAINDVLRYRPSMMIIRTEMRNYTLTPSKVRLLSELISENAYLPGHKAIDPKELQHDGGGNMFDYLFWALGRMHMAGLMSTDGVRKVKPLRGPDALLHAGSEVFTAGLSILNDRAGWPPIALPRFHKT